MDFLICSGYHETEGSVEQANLWYANTRKYYPDAQIAVVSTEHPFPIWSPDITDIRGKRNLFHIHHLLSGQTDNLYSGWSIAVVLLALYAYHRRMDALFKEQDCFAFGMYAEQMYADLGDGGLVFGDCKNPDGSLMMPCAQSLFLVRHSFIPTFVMQHLAEGPENVEANITEKKWERMAAKDTNYRKLSFGVDRGRPIPYDAPCFYAQHVDAQEMAELKRRGLL